jgi:taurine dioxygenase
MGSILHAIEVPPYGADTLWSNQYLAFSTLSYGLQTTLQALRGVHSATNAYSKKMQAIHDSFVGMKVHTDDSANKTIEQPAVRIHAETGQSALYVNAQYTVGLAGWAPHEARLLLDYLFQHSVQPAFTCRWKWHVGDVAFWDNRCVQHMAMADSSGHRRYMHRTTVAGEAPISS